MEFVRQVGCRGVFLILVPKARILQIAWQLGFILRPHKQHRTNGEVEVFSGSHGIHRAAVAHVGCISHSCSFANYCIPCPPDLPSCRQVDLAATLEECHMGKEEEEVCKKAATSAKLQTFAAVTKDRCPIITPACGIS